MTFANFLKNTKTKATKFFKTTLSGAARKGVHFFNTTLVPAGKQLHHVTKTIAGEVATNEKIPEHIRNKEKTAGNFADVGLSRLDSTQQSVNRVSKQLGID